MIESKFEVCEANVIHEEIVNSVRKRMPAEEPIYEVSELFKVFGDSTRARIICALQLAELCVCDLAAILGMTHSAVSHQLRILKASRLVKSRKEGRVVYYSLDDEHIGAIFSLAFAHVMEEIEG